MNSKHTLWVLLVRTMKLLNKSRSVYVYQLAALFIYFCLSLIMFKVSLYYIYNITNISYLNLLVLKYSTIDLLFVFLFVVMIQIIAILRNELSHNVVIYACIFYIIVSILQVLIHLVYRFVFDALLSDIFDIVFYSINILTVLIIVSFRSANRFASILLVAISWALAMSISIIIAYITPNYYFDFGLSVASELYRTNEHTKSVELLQDRLHSDDNCTECFMLLAFNYHVMASRDLSNSLLYLQRAKANFLELSLRRELNNLEKSILEAIELELSTLQ